MAVLWRKEAGGVRYEVRSAGRTLRLYANGVLHTQHNPARLFTGSVWDLLVLPALLLPRPPRRALVLGVGGGAAVHQLLRLFPDIAITAVELNPVHLSVARRFFGLRDARVTLVQDNAVTWLAMREGEPFDLVVDDLFGEQDGQPCRAVEADDDWFDLLATHLAPGGLLVVNFPDARAVRASAWGQGGGVRGRFPAALSLATPTCQNRVVAFLPAAAGAADLRRALAVAAVPGARDLRWRASRLR